MKKILTLLVLVLFSCALYAQGTMKKATAHIYSKSEDSLHQVKQARLKAKEDSANQADFSDEINSSPFIFEGTVIKTLVFRKGKNSYATEIIKIHKILKGPINCGTIKMIAKGIATPSELYFPNSQGEVIPLNISGIFLCDSNDIVPDSAIKSLKSNNEVIVHPLYVNEYQIYRDFTDVFKFLAFRSYKQLYKRILQEPKTRLIKCDKMNFQKWHDSQIKARNKALKNNP